MHFIFHGLEPMFTVREYMFVDGEHRFVGLEHKKVNYADNAE